MTVWKTICAKCLFNRLHTKNRLTLQIAYMVSSQAGVATISYPEPAFLLAKTNRALVPESYLFRLFHRRYPEPLVLTKRNAGSGYEIGVARSSIPADLTVSKRPGTGYRIKNHFAVFNHLYLFFPL